MSAPPIPAPSPTPAQMTPRLERFPDDLVRMAQFSKAIGHPARLDLLHVLSEWGPSLGGPRHPDPPRRGHGDPAPRPAREGGLVHAGRGVEEYAVNREAVRENGRALADFLGPLVHP